MERWSCGVSFNEFIDQAQPNPYNSPFAFSMGLPNDSERVNLWVDAYGTAIARDIAPSVEAGSVVYDTMVSCMRVMQCNFPSMPCIGCICACVCAFAMAVAR